MDQIGLSTIATETQRGVLLDYQQSSGTRTGQLTAYRGATTLVKLSKIIYCASLSTAWQLVHYCLFMRHYVNHLKRRNENMRQGKME